MHVCVYTYVEVSCVVLGALLTSLKPMMDPPISCYRSLGGINFSEIKMYMLNSSSFFFFFSLNMEKFLPNIMGA